MFEVLRHPPLDAGEQQHLPWKLGLREANDGRQERQQRALAHGSPPAAGLPILPPQFLQLLRMFLVVLGVVLN